MLMHACVPQRAHLIYNVLYGVGVVQHKGHRQMRAAQLVDLGAQIGWRPAESPPSWLKLALLSPISSGSMPSVTDAACGGCRDE